jgi:peptidoglycan/LPS O-acetylase OafA/YrhL
MEQGRSPDGRRVDAPHYPNSDFIRLVAASAVIFSHSFLIAEGSEQNEPLARLLGERNILGIYGVFVFFIMSGFFVAASAPSSASPGHFLWKRFLRIFPALFC